MLPTARNPTTMASPQPSSTELPHAAASDALVKPSGTPIYTVFLVLAVVALSALTLMLARENRQLKSLIAQMGIGKDTLKAGAALAPLTVIARDGASTLTAFVNAPKPTLLLISSSKCPHCDTQMPVWDAMIEQLAKDGSVRVLAIQVDAKSPADLKPAQPRFDFARVEAARSTWLGQIPGTPYTAVISTQGIINESWPGEFDVGTFPEIRKAIESALSGG
jgi:hypothetical protein